MLNQLNNILDYFKENLVLVIVLAVIVILIIGLVIAMIVIASKAKKQQTAAETTTATEEPAEEPAPAPAEAVKEEPEKQEEPAPAPEKKEAKKEAPAKAADEEPAAKKEPSKISAASGKWVIRKQDGKFAFDLLASNGEVMISSSVPYAALASAKTGIQTYKNNIAKGNFNVTETKNGDFMFQLLNARGALLASGNAYRTKANCENAIESTKRWAVTDVIEVHD